MRPLLYCLATLFSLSAAAWEPPAWEALSFERSYFWVTARAELALTAPPDSPDTCRRQLLVQSSLSDAMEQLDITFCATSGQTLTRSRYSEGSDQRLKFYEYHPTAILRERREPPGGDDPGDVPMADWRLSSSEEIALPEMPGDPVVVTPYTLLALLPTLALDPSLAENYLIHTDLNFFRLRVEVAAQDKEIEVNYELNGVDQDGMRAVREVRLRALPLVANPEDPDFSLMGLRGEIRVFLDRENGLPLAVEGDAPRVGTARLYLVSARLRPAGGPVVNPCE